MKQELCKSFFLSSLPFIPLFSSYLTIIIMKEGAMEKGKPELWKFFDIIKNYKYFCNIFV